MKYIKVLTVASIVILVVAALLRLVVDAPNNPLLALLAGVTLLGLIGLLMRVSLQ
jgi:NO-binding membrane sensor protein with MHYT domain